MFGYLEEVEAISRQFAARLPDQGLNKNGPARPRPGYAGSRAGGRSRKLVHTPDALRDPGLIASIPIGIRNHFRSIFRVEPTQNGSPSASLASC